MWDFYEGFLKGDTSALRGTFLSFWLSTCLLSRHDDWCSSSHFGSYWFLKARSHLLRMAGQKDRYLGSDDFVVSP